MGIRNEAWSTKFILLSLVVQNLFCFRLECKIYFASLRLIGVQNLFCFRLECKIYFASLRLIGVQNLFCYRLE
ncbi:MAG: hypothetical protein DRR00_17670 [Candidatus Parabeggiatoa sp. nov. 3]|nr:MAG: hypothetical protein DRR00_17670 [Gammaproteobacteria bacterium]